MEDSSEIASARISSSSRKSLKRTNKNQQAVSGTASKNISLSKISEEDIQDNTEIRKHNAFPIIIITDDEKVTSDNENASNDAKGESQIHSQHISDDDEAHGDKANISIMVDKVQENSESQFGKLVRFLPEFIDKNRITIV